MTPRLRKLALTAHVTSSVGWLGAVVAYLALAIASLTGRDAQMVWAVYLAMELIGWYVIVPCSLTALLTGLVQSLGTEWGVLRHYWILAKLLLTTVGTLVLLVHMQTVSCMAGIAAEMALSGTDFGELHVQFVVHAAGGLLVLLAATVLSVYKPWGRTPYGRRVHHERRTGAQLIPMRRLPPAPERRRVEADHGSAARTHRQRYVRLGIAGLAMIVVLHLVVLHLVGGGFPGH